MSVKVTYPKETFVALGACKLFFSCMEERVCLQGTGQRESLVALGAGKLFLSGMGELVCLEVT